jgi:hypothetical protein
MLVYYTDTTNTTVATLSYLYDLDDNKQQKIRGEFKGCHCIMLDYKRETTNITVATISCVV